MIVWAKRDCYNPIFSYPNSCDNKLKQLLLLMPVIIRFCPIALKNIEDIGSMFKIIIGNRDKLLQFLLEFYSLFKISIFVGDKSVIPTKIHAFYDAFDFSNSLLKFLIA